MISDELGHVIKHLVKQELTDQRPFVYGHIANYDASAHRVRCIIPSMLDDNGNPLLTPWMPMVTMSASASGSGGSYGGQVIYQGGSTVQNPTNGEQVVIGLFDRWRGVGVCLGTTYNQGGAPPATKLPETAAPNAAGDFLWSNPSGTLVRIRANGDIEVWGSANAIANITGNATVTVKGTTTVNSSGTATIIAPLIQLAKAASDALQTLCTKAFHDWAATHVHQNTSAPTTTPPANSLTTIVEAE